MQVNQGFNGLRVLNDQPFLRPPVHRTPAATTSQTLIDGGPTPKPRVVDGPPSLPVATFGGTLHRLTGPRIDEVPIPLAEPPADDKLGTQIRDFRETQNAAHADLVSQLKLATAALKEARQSGDVDAITVALTSIDSLNTQIQANRDSLSAVQNDVKQLRELRQHLTADVKAGNLDALQQDRDAITQQRAAVLADIQA